MQMEILDTGRNVTHVKLLGSMDANGAYENILRFENVVTSAREHALVDMSECRCKRFSLPNERI